MTKVLLIYNAQLLDESIDSLGAILIVNGKIRSIFQGYFSNLETLLPSVNEILKDDGCNLSCSLDFFDAKGLVVTPSFIDMHVHLRDPGLTQKEDLDSGLHACVAGGYGTVVAMPNTLPVISDFDMALKNMGKAERLGLANMFQSVSITKDFDGKTVSHLKNLERRFVPLVTEDGHDVLSSAVMLEAMKIAAKKGIIVSCHCEDPELALAAKPHRKKALEIMKEYSLPAWGGDSSCKNIPEDVLKDIERELSCANSLLELAENIATERNICIAKQASCHIHLCHVSTKKSIEYIRKAKKDFGEKSYEYISCEVTPHHLALEGTKEPNIRALVNPPLRSKADCNALINGILDGTVDVIATDHAPHTLEDKAEGAPGFSGIETAFAVCNTVLVQTGKICARKLSQLMSANAARILNLNKGLLKTGYDADITVLDPQETWAVDPTLFYSKGKATPFEGKKLAGKVKAVFINGQKLFEKF